MRDENAIIYMKNVLVNINNNYYTFKNNKLIDIKNILSWYWQQLSCI